MGFGGRQNPQIRLPMEAMSLSSLKTSEVPEKSATLAARLDQGAAQGPRNPTSWHFWSRLRWAHGTGLDDCLQVRMAGVCRTGPD